MDFNQMYYFSCSDMNYRFFVTDHLGNVRVVATAAGVIEQQNEFYPYGESIDTDVQFTSDNPYKWGGKEWDADMGAYDFGARMYSPSNMRWLTMDPLCEKYYDISPYVYCAGDPVNLVDPDGMQWYSYTDKDGNTKYKYWEGEMPEEEQAKYNNIQYLGYTYLDTANNQYYSLFGEELSWVDSKGRPGMGQLFDRIDQLLLSYGKLDADGIKQRRTSMHIEGLPLDDYRGFVYKSKKCDFTTIPAAVGSDLWNGNVFVNTEEINSRSIILKTPDKKRKINIHQSVEEGYWLQAVNPDGGADQGFTTLLLRFNQADAVKFVRAYNNIIRKRK